MPNYILKKYQPGYEHAQAEIAKENALEWIWSFFNTTESFREKYSRDDFDSDTVLYCFLDDVMIGYIHTDIGKGAGVFGPSFDEEDGIGASFDIPRVKKGHEKVAELLLEEMIIIMKKKGIDFLRTRVSTMRKNSVQLVESFGFKQHQDFPMGYKLYYVYELKKGNIDLPIPDVVRFDPSQDMEECSNQIANFFKISKEEAKREINQFDNRSDLVSHLVIRDESNIKAYCYALPNNVKKEVIATFYLDASNENYLKQLLGKTIENSIDKGAEYFLVDVIGDLLQYKSVFEELKFDKAAIWGIYEKRLD